MTIISAQHLEVPSSPPWPLAVGVLVTTVDLPSSARAERRLSLALGAYRLGYYLLDLIEVAVAVDRRVALSGGEAWEPVEALVARAGVDALVVAADLQVVPLMGLPAVLTAVPLRLLVA